MRVRGSSKIEATARPLEGGTELKGAVTDDTGRPVAGAEVQLRWAAPSGSALVLPPHEPCAGARARRDTTYAGPAPELTLEADTWGRFCVRFPLELPDGRLLLGYVDARGLLDGTQLAVNLGPTSDLELRFAPAPETLSGDRDEATVLLEVRARPTRATGRVDSLGLSWHPEEAPPVALGRRDASVGELVRFAFPTARLGRPGVGELRAVFGSGTNAAEARARVLVTATAELQAPSRIDADSNGEAELELTVASAFGRPQSGSVEARSGGRTVGIAPLANGPVQLHLRLGPGPRQAHVQLRYLPATPWWRPGPEHELAVAVPKPSPLHRLPWAILLLALASWIALSWRRPRRAERRIPVRDARGEAPRPPSVAWEAFPDPSAGWTGRLFDAHDDSPIAGAEISAVFAEQTLTATTDAAGTFHLPSAGPGAAQLVVRAPWHAPLDRPLPPPGRLAIALVTRRRALLARLVSLASALRPRSADIEPTPDEIARHAAHAARPDVARWARAVEGAAYGPDPVDAEREAAVSALEPRQT